MLKKISKCLQMQTIVNKLEPMSTNVNVYTLQNDN